jgi:hypothetical protein
VNGKITNFRVTSVRPYYRDEHTEIPSPVSNPSDDDFADEDCRPEPERPTATIPRRRGRPPGSKNKPKIATPMINITKEGWEAFVTQKELEDAQLAQKLRRKGKIITPGKPFELSNQAEIDGLIGRGVFRFEQFDPAKYDGIRIFKSRIVNEIKGKVTDKPYEKSRLMVQGYDDDGKLMILTQSPTI